MPVDANLESTQNQKTDQTIASVSATHSGAGVIIVGAGLAGWGVVDAIRAKDQDIAITMITADSGDRYHKPMLTMAISQNKSAADLIRATGVDAAEAANIKLMTNTRVTQIDADNQQVMVAANRGDNQVTQALAYDNLVLAMGAHPAFPKSLPEELVWHVNHIERFAQLQAELANSSQKIAIVGAGMVGTEIAEDLLKAGHNITLIDLNDAPLAQMLPPQATSRIKDAVRSQGIEFLGGCQVTQVTALDDGQYEVAVAGLKSNTDKADSGNINKERSIIVDHVIASTGLLVDGKLPESAGIEFDRRTGIVVDEQTLETSQPHIYAIGDCMSIGGVACRYVAPLRAQAATIADSVLGRDHDGYTHKPPMIRLKNKAISVMVTGVPNGGATWQTVTDTDEELVMEQLDDKEEIAATVTIKLPAA